jgi:hypothetical protein
MGGDPFRRGSERVEGRADGIGSESGKGGGVAAGAAEAFGVAASGEGIAGGSGVAEPPGRDGLAGEGDGLPAELELGAASCGGGVAHLDGMEARLEGGGRRRAQAAALRGAVEEALASHDEVHAAVEGGVEGEGFGVLDEEEAGPARLEGPGRNPRMGAAYGNEEGGAGVDAFEDGVAAAAVDGGEAGAEFVGRDGDGVLDGGDEEEGEHRSLSIQRCGGI